VHAACASRIPSPKAPLPASAAPAAAPMPKIIATPVTITAAPDVHQPKKRPRISPAAAAAAPRQLRHRRRPHRKVHQEHAPTQTTTASTCRNTISAYRRTTSAPLPDFHPEPAAAVRSCTPRIRLASAICRASPWPWHRPVALGAVGVGNMRKVVFITICAMRGAARAGSGRTRPAWWRCAPACRRSPARSGPSLVRIERRQFS